MTDGELREQLEEILGRFEAQVANNANPKNVRQVGEGMPVTIVQIMHLIHQQRERWESAARLDELENLHYIAVSDTGANIYSYQYGDPPMNVADRITMLKRMYD